MCTNRYTEVPAYVKKYQHITRYIYIYIYSIWNTKIHDILICIYINK